MTGGPRPDRARPPHAAPMNPGRRRLGAMLLLAGWGLAGPARGALTDALPYAVRDVDWVDPARSRRVPVRLYWPHAAAPDRPVPLVVFSHGIGGSRQGYSHLAKHWAAHGIASLHVQHVGSDADLWRGNPFEVVSRLQAAAQETEALARAADVRFALDQLLGHHGPIDPAAVDRARVIAAGHSYGANTTLLLVGAEVERRGRTITCLDDRIRAAVVISAPPFYGEPDLDRVLRNVSVPTLHVTATDDVIEIPGYRSDASDRLAVFEAVGSPRKLLAVFRGGSHSMFTDRAFTGGAALNPQVKRATADLALAFVPWAFDGSDTALRAWQAQWHGIVSRAPLGLEAAADSSLVSP